jgi:hypothetical protein
MANVPSLLRTFYLSFQTDMRAPAGGIGVELDVIAGRVPADVKWALIHLVDTQHPVFPVTGGQRHVEHIVPDRTREVVEENEPFAFHRKGCNLFPQLLPVRCIAHDRKLPAGEDEGNHVCQ